jgi:hypothetical protein
MHAMIDLPPRMTSRLAVFSTCGTRRYWLRRNLTCATARHVLWIMMNPSRADAQFNDATTTTTTNISARHGYDVHGVVNLSAQIEPNSANLAAASGAPDPVNDVAIERALGWIARHGGDIVIAWGACRHLKAREAQLLARLRRRRLLCLGRNADGSPRFPKYIPADTALISFDR